MFFWIRIIFRLPRIFWVLARTGVLGYLAKFDFWPIWILRSFKFLNFLFSKSTYKKEVGIALCEALQTLGPGFIKLGQALSTRADLIGYELAEGLINLQDKIPPFAPIKAKEIICRSLSVEIDEIFIEFWEKPITAASIAQVHKARIKNNQLVAVKLLRPNIKNKMRNDIIFFRGVALILESIVPRLKRLKILTAINQFADLSEIELDLRMEAAAGGKLSENLSNDRGIKVPKIFLEYSNSEILITEWIDGIRIDDVEELTKKKHDINKITEIAATSFFNQIFRDGFFHADMHPGNIFITQDNTLVPIDFGIMGYLELSDRIFLAKLLIALLQRDYDEVANLHFNAGMIKNKSQIPVFSQNVRALSEPFLGKSLKHISIGTVLGQILQISSRFEIEVQPQFNLLQKTILMAEGMARKLNPEANMWDMSKPLAVEWIKKELTFSKKILPYQNNLILLNKSLPDIIHNLSRNRNVEPKKSSFYKIIIVFLLALNIYLIVK